MSRRGLAVLGAALIVLAGGAGAFFSCFERRPILVQRGGSAEARRNPFLAAERLLAAMGHEVRGLEGPAQLDPLPPPEAILIFTPNRRTLSPARSAALLDWVEAGGHLIVEAWEGWDDETRRPDRLLDPLGFQAHAFEVPAVDGADDESGFDFASVPLPGAAEPLWIRFDARSHWIYAGEAPLDFVATGEGGDHLLHLRLGRGRLTAVTDSSFLGNTGLGDEDHAEVLLRLVRLAGDHAPVWIVKGEQWPSLADSLSKHARPALAAAALWLAAFVWRRARRRGPIRPAPLPQRRSWLEHLDAVGRYHWSHDGGQTLGEACRAQLFRSLEREHPGWSRLPAGERARRLASATGLEIEEVAAALDPVQGGGEAAFVRTVRTLERIQSQR